MNELVLAKWEEISVCMAILDSGREFQREQGFVQWPDGYPDRGTVEEDVKNSVGYLLKIDGKPAAYMYIGFDGDPAYPEIKGAWHSDEPYAVVHRIAIGSEFRGRGVADIAFHLIEEFVISKGFYNLRIDTDEQNKRMQHVLEKNGFSLCGTVIQGGGDRLAFDKQLQLVGLYYK